MLESLFNKVADLKNTSGGFASVHYIYRELDDIYIQYNILRLDHVRVSSFIFSRSILLKLLKQVKLIVFRNITNLLLIKKIVARFDDKE